MADQIAPLPVILLKSGQVVRFEAIDPTTGADVGGVAVTNASLYAASAGEDGEPVGPLEAIYLLPRDT
jgi:hypothetical protein